MLPIEAGQPSCIQQPVSTRPASFVGRFLSVHCVQSHHHAIPAWAVQVPRVQRRGMCRRTQRLSTNRTKTSLSAPPAPATGTRCCF